MVASVEVARPGYINLRLAGGVLLDNLREITKTAGRVRHERDRRGREMPGRVHLRESDGPARRGVGEGRGGRLGDRESPASGRLRAESEYYVNDYGNQVEALGKSLRFRVRERAGKLDPGEEIGAYPGEYLKELAAGISEENTAQWETRRHPNGRAVRVLRHGRDARDDPAGPRSLRRSFDNFFRESSLVPTGSGGAENHRRKRIRLRAGWRAPLPHDSSVDDQGPGPR